MQSSTRRGIQYPNLDRSDRPDVPLHIKNLIDALELDLPVSQGTFASRPANPGYPRWVYWGTDTNLMYYWDGSAWHTVGTSDVVPQTLIDAKGDLLVGLSDNVAGRLPISTNDFSLIADNAQPSGMKWARNLVLDMVAAKGDIIAGTAVDAATNVAVGANGATLIADSAQAAGVKWGAPVLAVATPGIVTVDINIPTAHAFVDGPSVSLVAGTWLLTGQVNLAKAGATPACAAKLWDGAASVLSSAGGGRANESENGQTLALTGIVTVGSTTTYKISATTDTTGVKIKAALFSDGAGNNASVLYAARIG